MSAIITFLLFATVGVAGYVVGFDRRQARDDSRRNDTDRDKDVPFDRLANPFVKKRGD